MHVSKRGWILCALAGLALAGCTTDAPDADYGIMAPEVLAAEFEIPDALEVLGNDEFLFVDRRGKLVHYEDGTVSFVEGLPTPTVTEFDNLVLGGFLDISLHPAFETNGWVYLVYDNADRLLTLARFTLVDDSAEGFEVLHTFNEFSPGSRIAWPDAEHLFVSHGAGGSPYPEPGPQDLASDIGKIHRLTAEGEVPADNPVFADAEGPTTVYSYGHRNPQGLYWDAGEQALYANEHGPKGGDELNRISAGGNFGWPLFSYGLNYDDTPVSELSESEAAEFSILPLAHWTPDFRVAPSGLLRVYDSAFGEWEGSFLMGALRPQHLLRYDPGTDQTEIVGDSIGRVRDVAQLPDGALLIAIDADSPVVGEPGRIVRLTRRAD